MSWHDEQVRPETVAGRTATWDGVESAVFPAYASFTLKRNVLLVTERTQCTPILTGNNFSVDDQ